MINRVKFLSKCSSGLVCNNLSRQPKVLRRFSTNPMFPERAKPEIDSLFTKTAADKSASATPDFLSNHGGKLALAVFGLAVAAFYQYYVGGQNRNKVEEQVLQTTNIEPYEIQELRYLNNLTVEQYSEVVRQCKEQFSEGFTTYKEFIQFLKTKSAMKELKLEQSHLLDRFIHGYMAQTFAKEPSPFINTELRKALYFKVDSDAFNTAEQKSSVSLQDTPLSVDLMLAALNMFMLEDARQRVEGLFRIAELNSSSDYSDLESNASNGSNTTSSNNSVIGNNSGSSSSGNSASFQSAETSDLSSGVEVRQIVSARSAEELLQLLVETDQIPPEKQTIESGVKYPFKEYRRKTPREMIAAFRAAAKITAPEDADLSLLELQTLLLSSQVCAWAECYRSKPK